MEDFNKGWTTRRKAEEIPLPQYPDHNGSGYQFKCDLINIGFVFQSTWAVHKELNILIIQFNTPETWDLKFGVDLGKGIIMTGDIYAVKAFVSRVINDAYKPAETEMTQEELDALNHYHQEMEECKRELIDELREEIAWHQQGGSHGNR
jgi:hypothetical protein